MLSITGIIDGTTQEKTIRINNGYKTISTDGSAYITKPDEPLSVYENQINALEAIYNR